MRWLLEARAGGWLMLVEHNPADGSPSIRQRQAQATRHQLVVL
jgi:hypothetical protein